MSVSDAWINSCIIILTGVKYTLGCKEVIFHFTNIASNTVINPFVYSKKYLTEYRICIYRVLGKTWCGYRCHDTGSGCTFMQVVVRNFYHSLPDVFPVSLKAMIMMLPITFGSWAVSYMYSMTNSSSQTRA